MTITQLKTDLREFIALSETITPGEWYDKPLSEYMLVYSSNGNTPVARMLEAYDKSRPNAAFIARSRNISPTMAKMLLTQIEALERLAKWNFSGWEGDHGIITEIECELDQILKLWEELL